MQEITSAANQHIKNIQQLTKRRKREEAQVFVVEGEREINLALASGYTLKTLYLTKDKSPFTNIETENTFVLTSDLMEKISYRGATQACLALFHYKPIEPIKIKAKGLYLIVEEVEKPGNLGAILRTADGAGVDAVFVVGDSVDLYNPNVLRASLGARFSQPIEKLSLAELTKRLQVAKIPIVATSPYAAEMFWQADLSQGVAWLLGSEKDGISEEAKALCDKQVKIPMHGKVDSLNVSVATAVVLYESKRQSAQ